MGRPTPGPRKPFDSGQSVGDDRPHVPVRLPPRSTRRRGCHEGCRSRSSRRSRRRPKLTLSGSSGGPRRGRVGESSGSPFFTSGEASRYSHAQDGIRAHQTTSEHRHHGPCRPRQDHPDRRHHQGPRRARGVHLRTVRPHRPGAGGGRARHHYQHRARRVRDRHPALRARGHARPRRLRQEHGHRRRAARRGDPRRLRARRDHAADRRTRAARPAGGRRPHRGRAQQGRRGRRRADRPGRAGGPRTAHRARLWRRRRARRTGVRPQGP